MKDRFDSNDIHDRSWLINRTFDDSVKELIKVLDVDEYLIVAHAYLQVLIQEFGWAVERNRIPTSERESLVLYRLTCPLAHANGEIAVFAGAPFPEDDVVLVDFTLPPRTSCVGGVPVYISTRDDMPVYSRERDIAKGKIHCDFNE